MKATYGQKIVDEAKRCSDPTAAAILCVVGNWLDGHKTYEGDSLHEWLDAVMGSLRDGLTSVCGEPIESAEGTRRERAAE